MNSEQHIKIIVLFVVIFVGIKHCKCEVKQSKHLGNCTNDYGCEGRLICMNKTCVCSPNFKYNSETLQCQEFAVCLGNDDCITYDPNRQCLNGKCNCGSGYKENTNNGRKCEEKPNTYGKLCGTNKDCNDDKNERCIDQKCQCNPDYAYYSQIQNCVQFKCLNTNNCTKAYDMYRHCSDSGSCICNVGYVEDKNNGNKCIKGSGTTGTGTAITSNVRPTGTVPTYSNVCSTSNECNSDYNQRCIDHTCRCEPDFVYNSDEKTCVRFDCDNYANTDKKCEIPYDSHRYCYNNGCVCKPGYREDYNNAKKCVTNGNNRVFIVNWFCLVIAFFGIQLFEHFLKD